MYGLSDRLKPLSAAEEQVLLALWDCPAPATRRDISEKLTATGWAPATVLNFVYRLEEKGWVKGGKAGAARQIRKSGRTLVWQNVPACTYDRAFDMHASAAVPAFETVFTDVMKVLQ